VRARLITHVGKNALCHLPIHFDQPFGLSVAAFILNIIVSSQSFVITLLKVFDWGGPLGPP
jgi:hypothetical protein